MLSMTFISPKFVAKIKSFTAMKHKIELKRLVGTCFSGIIHSTTNIGNGKSYSKPYVRRLCRCGVLIPIGIMLTGKHRAAF